VILNGRLVRWCICCDLLLWRVSTDWMCPASTFASRLREEPNSPCSANSSTSSQPGDYAVEERRGPEGESVPWYAGHIRGVPQTRLSSLCGLDWMKDVFHESYDLDALLEKESG
jgi:hypothetical protein